MYLFILLLNTYFVSRGVSEEKVLHVFYFFLFYSPYGADSKGREGGISML